MALRDLIEKLEAEGRLVRIDKPVSARIEAAAVMRALGDRPVLFTRIEGSEVPVAANLNASRALVAEQLGVPAGELLGRMLEAMDRPVAPQIVSSAPCQEVVEPDVDLGRLPLLRHYEEEGGPFITAGIFAARDPELGQNFSVHRCMPIDRTRLAVRVVPRDLHAFLERAGAEMDAALLIGVGANMLLAAAMSIPTGEDESHLAAALAPLELIRALESDILIPAETEIVLEGRFTGERHREGPFVDITGTLDPVREEPVFEVRRITRRRDPIYQALLPAGPEHRLLMGMPREATIFRSVSRVCRCLDVHLTSGGCGWLDAVVQIEKRATGDGRKAIEAAFAGHGSLKHAFIVDEDIDPADPVQVEWAMATRFQGDRDLIVLNRQKGSSLDPSAAPGTAETCKLGFDLTRPHGADPSPFRPVAVTRVEIDEYL